jgi:outer membrane lipoprotein-sorting protein
MRYTLAMLSRAYWPRSRLFWLILLLLPGISSGAAAGAADIIRKAVDHWRGSSSYSEMTMVIHRPDWERSMSMRGWTQGDDKSIVRVIAPQKDRGNGTLTDGNNMWSYSPKVNRVIKIPSSMMAQSWMGSDFSNKDIAKSDDIIDQYEHTLLGTSQQDGHEVYEIQSIPHDDAPVVWGKEVLRIRDDYILLEQKFFDQDGQLVKKLETLEIEEMGGRATSTKQRMGDVEKSGEWTEISIQDVQYDLDIPNSTFTLSNLRNPRNQ